MAYSLADVNVNAKLYDKFGPSEKPATPSFALRTVPADLATAVADIESPVLALMALLQGMTQSNVPEFSVNLIYRDAAISNVGSGENQRRADITYNLNTVGKTAVQMIRNPHPDIFVGATGESATVIDTSDATVIAWTDLFKETGGDFTLSDGETVDDTNPIVKGRLNTRKK